MMMEKTGNMVMTPQDKYDALTKRWERVETFFDMVEKNKYMSLPDVLAMLGYDRGDTKEVGDFD